MELLHETGLIDIHTHLGRAGLRPEDTLDAPSLVQRMDLWGISQAVVLPLHDSPSGWYLRSTTEDILAECGRYPGRLIPFAQIDPRFGANSPRTDFTPILLEYAERGCRGVGEITANLRADNPLVINLLRQCGAAGLPVLFHMAHRIGGTYGLVDGPGLHRLEAVIRSLPETTFIAHGPAFWSEMAGTVPAKSRGGYPTGPVDKPGAVHRLLSACPNLYGDLSAGSGSNAITRDPAYGLEFLDRFQKQLLFGTDFLRRDQEKPSLIDYMARILSERKLSQTAHRRICRDNAKRLLKLSPDLSPATGGRRL
jgi:uncharacterized protein